MTRIAAACTSVNLLPGLDRGDAGLLGGVDRVVDLALRVGELPLTGRVRVMSAVKSESTSTPGVEQQQVAVVDVAGVLDPVQRVGVVAGGADRVVADAVALVAGVEPEDALDPALAATAADRLGQVGDDGVEAVVGGLDGLAHLARSPTRP